MTRRSIVRHRRHVRAYMSALGAPRTDWTPHHDPLSRAWAVADVVPGIESPPDHPGTLWAAPGGPGVLDQGSEGACVGMACAHVAGSSHPTGIGARPPLTVEDAGEWYRVAQVLDEHPGNSYVGTSVLGGMKTGGDRGYWTGYRWAFSVDELRAGVREIGPAVIGIPWFSGMFAHAGDVPLTISGTRVGGHSLAVIGETDDHRLTGGPALLLLNSYGPDWGNGGRAWIAADVLAELLADRGEAAIPTGRPEVAPQWTS